MGRRFGMFSFDGRRISSQTLNSNCPENWKLLEINAEITARTMTVIDPME